MFSNDPQRRKSSVNKKAYLKLLAFQLDQGIKNNPKSYKIYDLKKQWVFGHYNNCYSNSYGEECKKFHEEMLELDKKVCQYGGRCDLDGVMGVSSYIKSHFNKKEDIENFYDSLDEFFISLDASDKRVAEGQIENLIDEFYFISANMAPTVDLHKYYLERKQKIDNKFKKAIELDNKYKALTGYTGGMYYDRIITAYENFKEPQMVKYYQSILNKTFIKKTEMIGPEGHKWESTSYTRREN